MSDVIVALDYSNPRQALAFAEKIQATDCALKIGSELFTAGGPDLVKKLVAQGFRVFLDLKFHDIPNQVAGACRSAASLGVWMINVHASGGSEMMRAAREAVQESGESRPLLIAVTVLTSMDEEQFSELNPKTTIDQQVKDLTRLSYEAGLDGVVCSAHEVPLVKAQAGNGFLTVTPGIRLQDNSTDDQKRVMTPDKARQAGSDYLVIGRSITKSENPCQTLRDLALA